MKSKSKLFFLLSVLCFVGAFICIVCGNFYYIVVILLGLGALFVSLGSVSLKKGKKNDGDGEVNEEQDK